MDAETIRKVFAEELDKRSQIDSELHHEHHAVMQEWIDSGFGAFVKTWVEREKGINERRKARTKLYMSIQEQVFGWGIIGLIGLLGAEFLKRMGVQL